MRQSTWVNGPTNRQFRSATKPFECPANESRFSAESRTAFKPGIFRRQAFGFWPKGCSSICSERSILDISARDPSQTHNLLISVDQSSLLAICYALKHACPGQNGHASFAALSHTVKTKFILGASGAANSSHDLLRSPSAVSPAISSCFNASGRTFPDG
jgi:hypothetical protein